MNSDGIDTESTVSGDQVTIPFGIRRALDIDDGDRLRWRVEDDGSVRVEVVRQKTETFAVFEGYDGDASADVTVDHDAWGVDSEERPPE